MTSSDLASRLAALMPALRGRLVAGQLLGPLTWFRVGGPAEALFTPADEADLSYFMAQVPADVPVYPLGVGSNMIVRDGGVRGVVIRLSPRGFGQVSTADNMVTAGAAALDKRVAEAAASASVGGLEFFFGIPGTIGGAVTMNAGANGGETKDVLVSARGVMRDGAIRTLSNTDLSFAYRTSQSPPGFIFTEALFAGRIEAPEVIRHRMQAVQHHRETAQPIREKTGGSTFKNPPGHSAWKLVDAAGCRGLKMGGAQVSEMHCNFLINTGDASAADIEALGEEVRRRVKAQSGVDLLWEIKRVGER
ncbi:MAG: UDP-N-acetylmuramate dehydrogenase [Hyphomicrobiales bacterium]|nr:UDP-N-acetylmuramate dehydrogenase [Hyphomicrobiales bacterium]